MTEAFFDYELPEALIAQHPSERRDQSRLLVVRRATGQLEHRLFADLPELLRPTDLLVLNDTRVIPARLLGQRVSTGGKWEGLFLHTRADGSWEMLCQTRGRLLPGEEIRIEPGGWHLTLLRQEQGHWLARPQLPGTAFEILEQHGRIPLPPYIRKGEAGASDRQRYQTVYAQQPGSVAAPTAGLHFTPALLAELVALGIDQAFVTLHVGVGTFAPVKSADYRDHTMHREWAQLPAATVAALEQCRQRQGRIVAVGTTVVRTLETVAGDPPLRPWSGETGLYIHPPYAFRCVDALVTNFHLPRSTLLLLVSAFAGTELLRQAYQEAIQLHYRFFSYGDAMLIL